MTKKDEFKDFVKAKPELVDYINNGEMSWQKFYELFDLYGEDRSVWDKFSGVASNTNNMNISKLTDLVKNVDMDSIQSHINTAQKALGFVQELTGKKSAISPLKGPSTPRPINKFFED